MLNGDKRGAGVRDFLVARKMVEAEGKRSETNGGRGGGGGVCERIVCSVFSLTPCRLFCCCCRVGLT